MTTTNENYQYPLDDTWTTQEIITVTHFYQLIEAANESSVAKTDLLDAYRAFKVIVPEKSIEKQIGRKFEAASGYSLYKTMREAQTTTRQRVRYRND